MGSCPALTWCSVSLEVGAQRLAEQLGITPHTAMQYAKPEKLAATDRRIAQLALL